MTKEEAITVLRNAAWLGGNKDRDHTEEAVTMAIKALEQPEPHWIPCSERLPEDDTEVFVYLFDRQYPYIAWVTDSCWFTEDFQVEEENYPKAWMPLPEPVKGRKEDGEGKEE